MAFLHRKFLVVEPDKSDKNYASPSCYMCYVCPHYCYTSPPPPPPPPPPLLTQPSPSQKHQVSTILVLMLCVLGAVFLLLSYLTISRYQSTSSRRRNSLENDSSGQDFMDENHGPVLDHPVWYIRTTGLSQSIIDSITAFKFKKGEGLIEGSDECSVCLSEFQEDEILRLLPKCSHAFHVNCIDTWLRSHTNCPVCRAPILINSGNSVNSNPVEVSSSDRGIMEEHQEREEVEDENNSQTRPREDDPVLESRCVDIRRKKFRVLSDLGDHRVKVDRDLELKKRSASMDLSMVYAQRDEGCCSGCDLARIGELISLDMVSKRKWLKKSYSHGRCIQKGSISKKRSFSFSGKRSLRKTNRSLG